MVRGRDQAGRRTHMIARIFLALLISLGSIVVVAAQDESPKPKPAVSAPKIYRCDLDLERAVDAAKTPASAEDRRRIQRVVEDQKGLYALFGIRSPDVYAKFLTSKHALRDDLVRTRTHFRGRDLSREVRATYAEVGRALGRVRKKAPDYWIFHGWSGATNARTMGSGKDDETIKVFLNLSALARGRHFEAALVHETTHTFQGAIPGSTLLDLAAYEGVATYVSCRLRAKLSKPDALFWSKQSFAAAEKHRTAIIAAFARVRGSAREADKAPFIYLGQPLKSVEGAPDRCAYYVGYLMVEAWVKANPKRPLGDLLRVKPADLWRALVPRASRRR